VAHSSEPEPAGTPGHSG